MGVTSEELKFLYRMIVDSIRNFYDEESGSGVIEVNANERCMAAQIFCRVRERMKRSGSELRVDYEYNRHGSSKKELPMVMADNRIERHDVIPDMIIHIIGTDQKNAIVIEFKKEGVESGFDDEKLAAFTLPNGGYAYKAGLHIVLGKTIDKTTYDLWENGIKKDSEKGIGNLAV